MNVTDYKEIWQIDAGGQIYEASFEEMAQWIFEGSILPQDMVRRGNLRWIEAQKVPALMQFFNAKDRGEPPPVFTSVVDGQPDFGVSATQPQNVSPPPTFASSSVNTNFVQPAEINFQAPQNPFEASVAAQNFGNQNSWEQPQYSQPFQQSYEPAAHEFNVMPSADFCSMHPGVPTAFLCGTCGNGFCPACPKSYGGSVKICPYCGAMCKSVKEVQQKAQAAYQYERAITKGFGAEDFFNALAYPFKYKTSLIVGAIMFMFFTLGQAAGSMGNIMLAGAGIVCWMMANMLTFGVLANTVNNFSQGRIYENFMPSFDDFSLLDDIVHPFFLSIATYLVSFGLLFIFIIGLVYFTWTTFNAKPPVTMEDRINAEQKKTDGGRFDQYEMDENGNFKKQPGMDEDKIEELQKTIQEQRKKELEAVTGKTREQEAEDEREMFNNFLSLGVPAVIIAFLLLLWGLFYYPAACLVAGYTKSFVATMKPSIGWETIRILGWDYIKILAMCFALTAAMFFIGVILGIIFYAFHLPGMGNLPAKAVGALFGFYFSVVYALVLGFALYKNADKLNLFKG